MRRRAGLGLIPVLGLAVILAIPVQTIALSRVPGSWTHVQALPDDVAVTTAVGGSDGLLWVFGTCEGFCIQTTGIARHGAPVTYAYDPDADVWLSGRGAPQVCSEAQAAALLPDGRIRLAGCWTDIVTDPGFRIAVYNPDTNRWALQTTYGPHVDPIVGLHNKAGNVLWYSETLQVSGGAVFVSGHRLVQKVSGVWQRYAKEPGSGSSDGAAFGSDGRVYVAGGDRNCFPQFGACDVPPVSAWSPGTNTWSQPTSLPTPRIRVAVAANADGLVFVVGGMTPDGASVLNTVEIYNPGSGKWLGARRLPDNRFEAIATSTPDGRVWVFGGYDAGGNPLVDGYVFGSR